LHRFGFVSSAKLVRFLAMKTADGKIQTALDACEICGSFGYGQEGKNLVCLNCAAEINPLTMGAGGGCNPIPLPSEVTNNVLCIAAGELEKAARLFPAANQTELTSVDPVCGMTVKINEAAAFETSQGKTHYFCSQRCRDLFHQNPAAKTPMK
jgi:YHS domain-containing protein